MKKILFKKLLSDCLIFFFISLFCTSIIIWVFQAVNFLDIIVEDGRDYLVYINFSLLNFPKILTKLIPFILFLSILYIIGKYEIKNELVIFWNFGINKIELVNFFIKFSILMMIIQILLTALIVPKTQDLARSFLRTSSINFFENFIKPRVFNATLKGLTIYSDSKDKNGNLKEIYLKKGEGENFQITYAKKGGFKKIGNNTFLELYFGETISVVNDKITSFKFSKSDFNLTNFEDNTTTYKKTQEVATIDLIKCYHSLMNFNFLKIENFEVENCRKDNINNIIKELYKRIIIPLYIPVLILISLLLIIKSKENTNYFRHRFLIFLIGLSAIIISEITIRFIDNDFYKNIKFFIIPIILIISLYSLFLFKFIKHLK